MKKMITGETAAAVAAALGTEARRWEKNQMVRYYLTAQAIEALGGGHATASTRAYVETAPVPHIGTWDVQHADVLASALEALAATAPADAPADEPATTTRQAWATIREWAAGHPGWRHVTSVDADGRGVTIDWADVQWPSRADDRGWMTIDADGNVAVGGKNGGCIRATRGYEPTADVVDAVRAIMAARQRQAAAYDAAYSGGYDATEDGDDYELISAHMREARRGRRAYDRW